MTASRRTVLGGVSALAASVLASGASLAATAASLGPDGDLLALRGPWLASVEAFEAALSALGSAQTIAWAKGPPRPSAGDFGDSLEDYERLTAALEDWRSRCDELEHTTGVTAACETESKTSDANRAIVEEIIDMPASTLAGVRFKIEVSANEEHNLPELVQSIMDDVVALADRSTS